LPGGNSLEKDMVRMVLRTGCALVFAMAGIVAAGQTMAGQPDWAGGKGNKGEQDGHKAKGKARDNAQDRKSQQRDDAREGREQDRAGRYFGDKHRAAADGYFREQFRSGHCPPGLARKNNGCLPPGHAKKWAVGKPLPREVIFYEVPRPLVLQFGEPPAGHRYVRVGEDILLIGPRTGVVIDAIRILGSM